jgi:hypothetical protein
MDALSATNPVGPEMYVLKQATKVQEEVVMQLLDNLQSQVKVDMPPVSGLADQGIGANLDIRG